MPPHRLMSAAGRFGHTGAQAASSRGARKPPRKPLLPDRFARIGGKAAGIGAPFSVPSKAGP